MGAVEDAVDAAAQFLAPFIDDGVKSDLEKSKTPINRIEVVKQASAHLQAINQADLAADPDAPYDVSLFRVVYGLLDLVTLFGILPNLSPDVAFSQRPKSTLGAPITEVASNFEEDLAQLEDVVSSLVKLLGPKGTGVEPLLSQRILPDVFSGLAELSLNPVISPESRSQNFKVFSKTVANTPTHRLLPFLTTYLLQPLPPWLKPVISKELSLIPLRAQGIRHTIEFLSMSHNARNSAGPFHAQDPAARMPIPVQAVEQASRLLVLPPTGMIQDQWFRKLAPQLLDLLDGKEGKDLSIAAGNIIAGGILSKRSTGAPGSTGWELFAQPLLRAICPTVSAITKAREGLNESTITSEEDLKTALRRLLAVVSSYSHVGLIKRLMTPLLLPLWALLMYARNRSTINQEWTTLTRALLLRHSAVACETQQLDNIARNLFWDGPSEWTYGSGSVGGVEIRVRQESNNDPSGMSNIMTRISQLDQRVDLLVSLLSEAKVSDDTVGAFFVGVTQRWLTSAQVPQALLIGEAETDPFAALVDAKLSQILATSFKDNLARSPLHIVKFMGQLITNSVTELQAKSRGASKSKKLTRANLHGIIGPDDSSQSRGVGSGQDTLDDENLVSFTLSIVDAILNSSNFKATTETKEALLSMRPHIVYLSQCPPTIIPPAIANAASSLLHRIETIAPTDPLLTTKPATDPLAQHRSTLTTLLSELTSTSNEPPDRTWALHSLQPLVQDPTAFSVIDMPSLTITLLSASLADPESYVHTAASPVLVSLTLKAPQIVIPIVVDAYLDVDEQALKLSAQHGVAEKEEQLRYALDYRLRLGEVLNSIILDDTLWEQTMDARTKYSCARRILEACLFLASRRGQRSQTRSVRTDLAASAQRLKDEGETAWDGPIPSFLDESSNPADVADYEALQKVVHGWEHTGLEEDLRIRASALSVLSALLEQRLRLVTKQVLDAALQIVSQTLIVEREERAAIVRRAGVLVVMGLLRAWSAAMDRDEKDVVSLSVKQQRDVESVMGWIKSEDQDELVRDHASNVLEGFETLRTKGLYKASGGDVVAGPNLELSGGLRGINIQPDTATSGSGRKMIVEELE